MLWAIFICIRILFYYKNTIYNQWLINCDFGLTLLYSANLKYIAEYYNLI